MIRDRHNSNDRYFAREYRLILERILGVLKMNQKIEQRIEINSTNFQFSRLINGIFDISK